MRDTDQQAGHESAQTSYLQPSETLLRAALSALVGLTFACDSEDEPEDTDDPDHEHAREECEPKGGKSGAGESGAAGRESSGGSGGAGGAAGRGGSGSGHVAGDEVEKEISKEDKEYQHSEIAKMCEDRNGYLEQHGSCSGVNTCQGFFYGDWGADGQILEHSCSGANGCAGFNCVIPKRAGEPTATLTGEEIMKLDDKWFKGRAGTYGAKACRQCHISSEFNETIKDYEYDYTKLKMPVQNGSGRTNMETWLKRSAEYQEKIIAFGARSISEDGHARVDMVSYAKLFSKQEIKNVVEHMRKFDPKNVTFKELPKYPRP